MKILRFPLLFLIAILAMSIMAFSFLSQEIGSATQAAIVLIVALLVGAIGPHPLEVILGWLHLHDQAAVFFVWLLSLVVGVIGLLLSRELLGFELTWENALAIGQLIFAASQYAYQRLKQSREGPTPATAPPA